MKKSLTTLAAAVLFGSTAIAPLAIAQDATGGASNATGTAPSTDTMAPAGSGAAGTGMTSGSTATTNAAGELLDYVTMQTPDQLSVNDFMGQSVYTADNETIGTINDLLVQRDGGIVAAVVGVGGFLGIGEKNVALPMSKITLVRADTDGTMTSGSVEGDVRLTTTETADSLRNAPEFVELDEQDNVMDNRMGVPATNGTTGTTGTTTPSTDN